MTGNIIAIPTALIVVSLLKILRQKANVQKGQKCKINELWKVLINIKITTLVSVI